MDNLEKLYEEQKSKIKVIECDNCKEEFLWLSVKIEKLIIDDSKHGLHFVYRYFLCPKCGQPYTICIDDSQTLVLEQKFNMLRKRLDKKRRKGILTEEDVEKFKKGITLDDGYTCKEAILEIQNASDEGSEIVLTIQEGKFHQVKRMFEAVGKKVTYLKRIEFGTLPLDDDLEEGEYRELTEEEVAILKGL